MVGWVCLACDSGRVWSEAEEDGMEGLQAMRRGLIKALGAMVPRWMVVEGRKIRRKSTRMNRACNARKCGATLC